MDIMEDQVAQALPRRSGVGPGCRPRQRHQLPVDALRELTARVTRMANHQVRTPMTVIRAHLELLEEELDGSESADRALRAIGKAMDSLTDALDELTRAHDLADAADPRPEPVDLVEVVGRALTFTRASHPGGRFRLGSRPADGVPVVVDPAGVRRAVVALVEALIDAGSEIDLVVHVHERPGTVDVQVVRACGPTDEGAVDRSVTPEGDCLAGRVAWGLTLAETVARVHDGRVEIVGTSRGTTATLSLAREPRGAW